MADIDSVLSQCERAIIAISGKEYMGTIIGYNEDKGIIIKIAKPDITLIHLMSKTPCQVKMVSKEGKIYIFNTLFLNKKIPIITLQYPDKVEDFSPETLKKVDTSIWCSIVKENNEEAGNGTIVEMNILGCRLMSDYQARLGAEIYLSMMYNDDDSQPPLKVKGIVKNSTPAPYDTIYYNIDFTGLSEETKKEVKNIIDTPTA